MQNKLFDSELRVLELLWEHGDLTAKQLAARLQTQVGWSKTTTYTVIKKCIEKGVVSRGEPNFLCHARITREQAQKSETDELIDRLYGGAPDRLVASILGRKNLSAAELARLRQIIRALDGGE